MKVKVIPVKVVRVRDDDLRRLRQEVVYKDRRISELEETLRTYQRSKVVTGRDESKNLSTNDEILEELDRAVTSKTRGFVSNPTGSLVHGIPDDPYFGGVLLL